MPFPGAYATQNGTGGFRANGLPAAQTVARQLDAGPEQRIRGGKQFDFTSATGAMPRRVTFVGAIDRLPVPRVAVTLEQSQRNGLFVKEDTFAFFALGPSNLGERALAAGEVLTERYVVLVQDR